MRWEFRQRPTKFSLGLRRCLLKFRQPFDDGRPLFRAELPTMVTSDLHTNLAAPTVAARQQMIKRVWNDDYSNSPSASANMFLDDVTAVAAEYPDEMAKSTDKGVKVIDSLAHATNPTGMEYLFNNTRFIARDPTVKVMYGTTRNEAFHLELKNLFRNVRGVRARRAHLIGDG